MGEAGLLAGDLVRLDVDGKLLLTGERVLLLFGEFVLAGGELLRLAGEFSRLR